MIAVDTEGYWRELRSALEQGPSVTLKSMMLASPRSAAIMGVRELWTSDRDFNRFPTLTVVNSLVV